MTKTSRNRRCVVGSLCSNEIPPRDKGHSYRILAGASTADAHPECRWPRLDKGLKEPWRASPAKPPGILVAVCAVSIVALLSTGCMITPQSLLENRAGNASGERLIKPYIPDSTGDVALASMPASRTSDPAHSGLQIFG